MDSSLVATTNEQVLEQAYAIVEKLEYAIVHAENEAQRLIRHFVNKAEADEVERMKKRIHKKASRI